MSHSPRHPSRPSNQKLNSLRASLAIVAACAVAAVSAQAPPGAPGEPRWMPIDRIQGGRTADALAVEKGLLAFVERVKALPVLNPPPGVYPRASLSYTAPEPGMPHRGELLLGFWPPEMTRVRAGRLEPAGELSHLIVYVNWVRTESMDRTYWKDSQGELLPQPRQVGELQGFPVYEGFGGTEVSGILVIQPAGRSLFEPVSRERFHTFEVQNLEKEIGAAAPALKTAQEKYAALTSPAGREAQEKRIADSLAQYEKARPRTAEQMAYRAQEVKRLEAEEEARLKADASPEGNRLVAPLSARLAAARSALAALTATERQTQACHAPDSRVMGPHPVAPGTPGCQPIVSVSRWQNPSLPRSAWQLLSVERYWPALENVRRGVDRARSGWHYVNKDVVEAMDWQAIASTMLR